MDRIGDGQVLGVGFDKEGFVLDHVDIAVLPDILEIFFVAVRDKAFLVDLIVLPDEGREGLFQEFGWVIDKVKGRGCDIFSFWRMF